jgi:HlyD family secretion protein
MFWPLVTCIISVIGIFSAISLVNYPPPPPNVTTMYAQPPKNPFVQAVAASGIVECYGDNIEIGVPVEGLIQEVFIDVGDFVKMGAPLFQVDDRVQKATLQNALKEVGVKKARLKKAQSLLARILSVKDIRAVSAEDVQNRKNDVTIAKNEYKLALSERDEAEMQLERTVVHAPKDGVILRNRLRKGEYANFSPKEAPLIMGNIQTLQVRADVDEQSAWRIKPDQKAYCFIRGAANQRLSLTFDHLDLFVSPKISLTSASDEKVDTRVLQVIYRLDVPDDFAVYPGQQVDVYINAPMRKM